MQTGARRSEWRLLIPLLTDDPVFTGGELDEVLDFRLGVAARVLHTWRTAGTSDRGREGAHSPVRALLRAHLHVARRPSA